MVSNKTIENASNDTGSG
jgi:hypothetical protein